MITKNLPLQYCLLISFIILLLSIVGCRKEIEQRFEIPYEVAFDIPAGLDNFNVHYFDIKNVPTNIDAIVAGNGVTLNDIPAIRPKEFQLTSVLGIDYDFIYRINIYLFDETDPANIKEIAYYDEVPLNTSSFLSVQPSLVDAKPFLSKPYMNVRVRLQLRHPTSEFIESRLRLKFYAE
ncbi:MAG: hypothetical protein KA974_03965 [Saprospiraceae bacterium]|nr:hypothetical protein [Saprospiraceae bacterium]MBP7680083.1 hypothetical protein [Saprospiraceae bacterium]